MDPQPNPKGCRTKLKLMLSPSPPLPPPSPQSPLPLPPPPPPSPPHTTSSHRGRTTRLPLLLTGAKPRDNQFFSQVLTSFPPCAVQQCPHWRNRWNPMWETCSSASGHGPTIELAANIRLSLRRNRTFVRRKCKFPDPHALLTTSICFFLVNGFYIIVQGKEPCPAREEILNEIATNARARAHAHTHAHVHTRTRTHARARTRTCPRARTHAETLSFRLEIIPKQSAATDPTNGFCVDVLIATLFHLPQVRLLPF